MLTAIFIPLLLAEQAPALVLICWSDLAGGPWTQIPAPSGCGSQSLPLCPSPPSSLLHSQEASPPPPPPHRQHLQTSLLLEKRERRITSGAIPASGLLSDGASSEWQDYSSAQLRPSPNLVLLSMHLLLCNALPQQPSFYFTSCGSGPSGQFFLGPITQ